MWGVTVPTSEASAVWLELPSTLPPRLAPKLLGGERGARRTTGVVRGVLLSVAGGERGNAKSLASGWAVEFLDLDGEGGGLTGVARLGAVILEGVVGMLLLN